MFRSTQTRQVLDTLCPSLKNMITSVNWCLDQASLKKLFVSTINQISYYLYNILRSSQTQKIHTSSYRLYICIITYRATLRNKQKLLCNSCILILYQAYVHNKKKIKINILLRLRWIWRKDLGRQKVVQQRVQRDCANFVFWL